MRGEHRFKPAGRDQVDGVLATLLKGERVIWPAGADEAFFDSLLKRSLQNGVAMLLQERLQRAGGPLEPPSRLEEGLNKEAGRHLLRQGVLDRELARVLKALADTRIRCLVLKGAAVSRTVYPAPHYRPRSDSDLWVPEADLPRVSHCLSRIGYLPTPATGSRLTQSQRGYQRTCGAGCLHLVDVHWRISNVQLFADVLAFDAEWERRVSLSSLSPAGYTLNPISSLLLACVHRVAHHGAAGPLIWLADIHRLSGVLSSDEQRQFIRVVDEKQLAAACRDGLRVAFKAFPDLKGAHILRQWLELAPPAEDRSARFLRGANDRVAILISDWRHLPGARNKLWLLKEHLVPPVAYMRQRYPGRGRLVLPWLYLRRAGAGAWRLLFTRARRVSRLGRASRGACPSNPNAPTQVP